MTLNCLQSTFPAQFFLILKKWSMIFTLEFVSNPVQEQTFCTTEHLRKKMLYVSLMLKTKHTISCGLWMIFMKYSCSLVGSCLGKGVNKRLYFIGDFSFPHQLHCFLHSFFHLIVLYTLHYLIISQINFRQQQMMMLHTGDKKKLWLNHLHNNHIMTDFDVKYNVTNLIIF